MRLQKILKKINTLISDVFIFIIAVVRPFIAPKACCIYPVSCTNYTRFVLQKKPLYIALPLIFIRILSCNSITVIFYKISLSFKKTVFVKNK